MTPPATPELRLHGAPPPAQTAILWKDTGISYADLLTHSAALAALYFSSPGERIVLFSENRPEWISALYSIWRNHCVVVPVDAMCPAGEVAYILGQTEPVALFCSAKTRPVIQAGLARTPRPFPRLICFDEEEFPAMPSGAVATAPLMSGASDAPRGHPLHLRHHRQPQGRHAHLRQPQGQSGVRLRPRADLHVRKPHLRPPALSPYPAPDGLHPRAPVCRRHHHPVPLARSRRDGRHHAPPQGHHPHRRAPPLCALPQGHHRQPLQIPRRPPPLPPVRRHQPPRPSRASCSSPCRRSSAAICARWSPAAPPSIAKWPAT
jgi:hypothetical protein